MTASAANRDWGRYFRYQDGRLYHKERKRSDFRRPGTVNSWNRRFARQLADTSRQGDGYRLSACPYGQSLTHRIIWEMHHGPIPKGLQIDHVNRDKQDNRIENLRLATPSQNNQNSVRKPNACGLKGVFGSGGRFYARIYANRTEHYLGSFQTAEEAHEAYKSASAKLHGSYGRAE